MASKIFQGIHWTLKPKNNKAKYVIKYKVTQKVSVTNNGDDTLKRNTKLTYSKKLYLKRKNLSYNKG